MKPNMKQDQIKIFIEQKIIQYFKNSELQIKVILTPSCLVIRIHKFLDDEMEGLIHREDLDVFRSIRELMMEYVLKDIKEQLMQNFNIEVKGLYYDWDEHDESSMIVAMLQNNNSDHISDNYKQQNAVDEQLMKITYHVEKYPESVSSFWIDHSTLIMVRTGLLVLIERELVKQRFQEVLRKTKRVLEKKAFHDSEIESIIGRPLQAMYLDWDFDQDRSILVYSFAD